MHLLLLLQLLHHLLAAARADPPELAAVASSQLSQLSVEHLRPLPKNWHCVLHSRSSPETQHKVCTGGACLCH